MNFVCVKDRLPDCSCHVVAVSAVENSIYGVMNVQYSAKWKKFNVYDWYTEEEVERSAFDSVIAWCPFSELKEEINGMMEVKE